MSVDHLKPFFKNIDVINVINFYITINKQ